MDCVIADRDRAGAVVTATCLTRLTSSPGRGDCARRAFCEAPSVDAWLIGPAGSVAQMTSGEQQARRRTTARGEATRARMILSAAELMYVRGVNAVTLDDVRAATGTSKSQLYKHFPGGKPELVRAVVALRGEQVLAREGQRLARLKSISGLRRWRDALIQGAALQGGAYGCALGNLVVEVADQDDQARTSLSQHFANWEALLANGFRRMINDGNLPADSDPAALATGLMAALQGGYLLAQAEHDVTPMATALDMALAHIDSLAKSAEDRQVTRGTGRGAADSVPKTHKARPTRRVRASEGGGSAAVKR